MRNFKGTPTDVVQNNVIFWMILRFLDGFSGVLL